MSPKLGLLAGLVVAGFMAPAAAEAATYTVTQSGWIHRYADPYSARLWQVPYGSRVSGNCGYEAWCYITWRNYKGYFPTSYLQLYVPPPPPPKYVAPPTYYPPAYRY